MKPVKLIFGGITEPYHYRNASNFHYEQGLTNLTSGLNSHFRSISPANRKFTVSKNYSHAENDWFKFWANQSEGF